MRYIPDPGPWMQFRNRPENQKLSLTEATQAYKQQQMYHSLQNQQTAHMAMHSGKSTRRRFQSELELRIATVLWATKRNEALGHYGPINTWDVSGVKNMVNIFEGLSDFNDDISNWDVSNVQFMTGMFFGASSFNQDISSWNVENVKSMAVMFQGADAFECGSGNIADWNPFSLENAAFFMGRDGFGPINYSTAKYNALLVAWNAHGQAGQLKANVGIDFGSSQATDGGAGGNGATARTGLRGSPTSWTIVDGDS